MQIRAESKIMFVLALFAAFFMTIFAFSFYIIFAIFTMIGSTFVSIIEKIFSLLGK